MFSSRVGISCYRSLNGKLKQVIKGIKHVSLTDCDCLFRKYMVIPCRHNIICFREEVGMYFVAMMNSCAIKDGLQDTYYQDNQRIFVNVSLAASGSVEVTQVTSKPTRVLKQYQKYWKAMVFTSELESEVSGIHFDRRIA